MADDWDRLRALHYSEDEIEKAVLAAAGPGPFDLVVDFGTGTGRMLALFAGMARRVEGIDLSHQMLTVARSKLEEARAANASVRHGDATASPYPDNSASLVIIHQVLHFLDDPGRALVEAARVLTPGGRLIVVEFAPHTLEHLRAEHAHRHLGVSEARHGALGRTRRADRAGRKDVPRARRREGNFRDGLVGRQPESRPVDRRARGLQHERRRQSPSNSFRPRLRKWKQALGFGEAA